MLKSISFGKTLVANCQVKLQPDNVSSCKIFELEKSDSDYFIKVKELPSWSGNRFLWVMKEQTKPERFSDDTQIFVLESDNGECLGYVDLISRSSKLIQYLEVAPEIIKSKNKILSKDIARSLIVAVVNAASKENMESVSALAFDFNTKKFYTRNCGFKSGMKSAYDYTVDKKQYSKFLEKNIYKDGVRIDFDV